MGATGPQGFGCEAFYVAQIPCRDARAIIIAHHYSHRVVNNSYLHLGVFREGALEAACFAIPETRSRVSKMTKKRG